MERRFYPYKRSFYKNTVSKEFFCVFMLITLQMLVCQTTASEKKNIFVSRVTVAQIRAFTVGPSGRDCRWALLKDLIMY